MGQELATGYVSIVASTKGLGRDITREFGRAGDDAGGEFTKSMGGKAKSGIGGIGSALGGALKLGLLGAAAGAGLAIGGALKDGIKGASDLEQSIGGVQAVFKQFSGQIESASKTAATNLGLTRNSYNELATTLGAGLKNKGIADFAGQTQKLIGLGADLAAQFGGSTQEAVEAISSLMRGETDPIERYGVAINETAINAELAARGQDKLKGAALEQAKAQARVDLLFRQTRDAQGAFARESDTFAGKQQRAAAQWDDLKTKIGSAFLPVLSDAMGFISGTALPALDSFGKAASDAWGQVQAGMSGGGDGGFFATLGGQLSQLPALFDQVKFAWGDFVSGFQGGDGDTQQGPLWVWQLGQDLGGLWSVITTQVVPAVTSLWQTIAAQLQPILVQLGTLFTTVVLPALSSLFTAVQTYVLPAFAGIIAKVQEVWATVGPIVLQIVGTIVAKFQELSPQINAAMTQVGQIIGAAMNLISTVIGVVLTAIKWLWSMWGDNIMAMIRLVMDTVWRVIQGALNVIQGVIRTVLAVISGDWAGAWEGIKQILSGVWQIIEAVVRYAIENVKATIGLGLDLVKGIFSAAGSFLVGIWRGMWDGIKSLASGAMDAVKGGISTALDAIKGFFDANVRAVTTIWDKLKSATRDPVAFVVNTVINDGLIGGWNKIAGSVGLGRIEPLPRFQTGGRVNLPWSAANRDPYLGFTPKGAFRFEGQEAIISRANTRRMDSRHPGALDHIIATGSLPAYAEGGRVHPVPGYPANWGRGYHGVDRGLDIPAPMGTPVVAMRDATVNSTARWGYSYGYHIRTSDGAVYAHLSQIGVTPGQQIRAGQVIGAVGDTGNSFGPHLHVTAYGGASAVGKVLNGAMGAVQSVTDWLSQFKGLITGPLDRLKTIGGGNFGELAAAFPRKIADGMVAKVKAAADKLMSAGDPAMSGIGADSAGSIMGPLFDLLKKQGHPRQVALIAGITAMQEASGRLDFTPDENSDVGPFQQRTPRDGTIQQLNDLGYALDVFLRGVTAKPGNGDRGGYHVPGPFDKPWQRMSPGQAAQAVQVSAYPSYYDKHIPTVNRMLDARGYVNGTRWSGGGLHPLSEDGRPELVVGAGVHRLRAGTRVFNANETQQLMGGTNVTYSPIVQSDDKHERQMEDFLFKFAQDVRAHA